MVDKVANFLSAQLQKHANCVDLRHFKDIFEKFRVMGATSTGAIKIIVKLIAAATDTDAMAMVDFSDVDVVDRNTFWDTSLWQSYCEGKFRSLMEAAKTALAADIEAHATGQPPAAEPWTDNVELALQIRPVCEGLL